MTGDGADDVGRFVIAGQYDSGSLECLWTKTYPGSHAVSYRGFREGKGIWGTWEIKSDCRGGFHIWPRGSGEGAANKKEFTEPEPVDAIAESDLAPVEK